MTNETTPGAAPQEQAQDAQQPTPPAAEATETRALDPTLHSAAVRDFEKFLDQRIVGQKPAIEAVTDMYQMFLVSLNPPDRPVGNLLFLGPTGSGKTYVVEVVAEALFGSRHAFIKVDCAEFQQPHEIAKLIGSPPGYVGHGQTPALITQAALAKWHTEKLKLSLMLFDEIEKASDALWQLLLGILDKASLTLGDNSHVDLSRCMIFMTSNLGATEMGELVEGGIGFVAGPTAVDKSLDDKIARSAMEAARHNFSPEFMNRIDKVVVFQTLRPEQLAQILDLELAKVQDRIAVAAGPNQFSFCCKPEVKRWLLSQGTDPRYGARHLKRVIERNIVYALANLVATAQVKSGECVDISLQPNGTLAFSVTAHVARAAALEGGAR